jgi:predicted outer membrane protein
LVIAAQARAQDIRPAAPRAAPRDNAAQPRETSAQPARQPQEERPAASTDVNVAEVAGWLILGNEAEVELGKLAQQKSKNDQVREFAAMMIKDHSEFITKLQKFAGRGAASGAPRANGEVQGAAPREGAAPATGRTQASARPQAVAKGQFSPMFELGRKSSQLKLAMTKQLLSKYEGQDFDMGYLGQQIGAHVEMLACLTVAKEVGPEDFRQLIDEGVATTREHLQHAQKLAHQLEDKEGADRQDGAPRGGTVRPDTSRSGASDASETPRPRIEGDTITPTKRPEREVPQREKP